MLRTRHDTEIEIGGCPAFNRRLLAEIRQDFPGDFIAAIIQSVHQIAGPTRRVRLHPE